MAKEKKIHKRKKIGEKTQAAEESRSRTVFEEPIIEKKGKRAAAKNFATARGEGTRYSCLYSTVRKKAGTTYSPKYSPKH